MVYTVAPYAMKAGYGIAKYGALATRGYRGARTVYKAVNALQRYKGSALKSTRKTTAKRSNFRSKADHGDEGHGMTRSTVRTRKRKSKAEIRLREALPLLSKYTSDNILQSAEGRQNFTEIASIWYQSQLQSYAASTTAAERRFFVVGGSLKACLTNFTSTPVHMVIYDLRCKENMYSSDTSANTVANGLNAKYNASDQATIPWQSPRESTEFRRYWTVLGTKNIILNPGETHVHDFFFKIDKYYTNNTDIGLTTPNYQKGFTHSLLVRTLGTLVKESGASTKITYAVTKVGNINHFRLDYKTPVSTSTNTLIAQQASKPQTGLANETYMDEDTGVANPSVTV